MSGLTKEQCEILNSTSDLIITGPPGSGKTTIGLAKAEWLLENTQVKPYQRVLFLSFSNSAVRRIREASRGLLSSHPGRLHITTYHGFCHDLLTSHGRLVGLAAPFSLLPPTEERIIAASCRDEAALGSKFARLEREEGKVRFDRFIALAVELLERHAVLREGYSRAYPLIVADEYQDTDDAQEQLVLLISQDSQLICMGDPNQRIYDWRPGVQSDRFERLEKTRKMLRLPLTENLRSATFGILEYAEAVLHDRPLQGVPDSVAIIRYKHFEQSILLKRVILRMEKAIAQNTGKKPRDVTLGIMGYSNRFVARLSNQLRKPTGKLPAIEHSILIDTEELALCWDTILTALDINPALDPKKKVIDVLRCMERFETVYGVRNDVKSSLERATTYAKWAAILESGKKPPGRLASFLEDSLQSLSCAYNGDPMRDLTLARDSLRAAPGSHLSRIASFLDLRLPAGPFESAEAVLAESYRAHGYYAGAVEIGRDVLRREQVMGSSREGHRRLLMTLHRCKGREFDGVVIVEDRWSDRLVLREDKAPEFPRSRRLLHTAMTRARFYVCLLTPVDEPCVLLPRTRVQRNRRRGA